MLPWQLIKGYILLHKPEIGKLIADFSPGLACAIGGHEDGEKVFAEHETIHGSASKQLTICPRCRGLYVGE